MLKIRFTQSFRPFVLLCLSILMGSGCKPLQLTSANDEESSVNADQRDRSGGESYFSMLTGGIIKRTKDRAKAAFIDSASKLASDPKARKDLIGALCSRLPVDKREACMQHAIIVGDFTAGAGSALAKDITEAAEGVHAVISNPESMAEGVIAYTGGAVQDPVGAFNSVKEYVQTVKDDVIECWNSGTEGKGTVIGHAGLLLIPEFKGAEAARAASVAGKVVQFGARGHAVITEVKKGRPECQIATKDVVDPKSGSIFTQVESTLTLPVSLDLTPEIEAY